MTHRFQIEFVVDVPNEGVAGDVRTRLREQQARLREVLAQVTGHEPLGAPDRPGIFVLGPERVDWDAGERDWVGEEDGEDDDDDD